MKKLYYYLVMAIAMFAFCSETSAYRLYVENQTSWGNLTLYAWGEGQPEYFGSWPGAAATGTETIENIDYLYWEIGEGGETYNLIFNNSGAGSQLPDYKVTFDRDYYLLINNLGCIEQGSEMTIYKIYVDDQSGWDNLHVYGWGEGNVQHFGAWPGATATGTETVDGVDYKYFEVAASDVACNLIFNNGAGTQFDGPIVNLDKDYYFQITSNSYTVISGEIVPTPDPEPKPSFAGGFNVYLNPTDVWSPDGAWFSLYVFGANGDAWATMADSDADGIYETVVPEGEWNGLIFVRQNPEFTEPGWNEEGVNRVWGQTADLVYDGVNDQYTITSWGEDGKANGEWGVYGGTVTPDPDPKPSFAGGFNVYLNPTDVWSPDGAWFSLYVFGANGDAWATMADSDADGIYETVVPEGEWNGLIFVRQNPEFTEPGWNEEGVNRVWGQTADLVYDGVNDQYTITSWGEDGKANGEWSVYDGTVTPDPDPDPKPTFDGGFNVYLNPTDVWSPDGAWFALYMFNSNDNYEEWLTMTDENADGIYEAYFPEGAWSGFIFVRQNPENSVAAWENSWGQTQDLTYDGINNLCVITGWDSEGKATHEWNVFTPSDNPDPDPTPTAFHRIYINDCSGWLTLNVYAFVENSSYQPLGAWPGAEFVDFVEFDGVNYKYYELPETEFTYKLIFSNNGDFQFDGPEIVPNKDYFFKVTADSYEELIVNSINSIETDTTPAEYYNLQGVRVMNPENGLYIRRQGNKAEKVFINNK